MNTENKLEKPKKRKNKNLRNLIILIVIIASGGGFYHYKFHISANFKEVIPDKVYRSAQPSMKQLKEWIEKYNLATVINLRGPHSPVVEEEEDTVAQTDAELIHVELSAYYRMTTWQINDLIKAIESAKLPMLLHCNHGVDRSGTASALTLYLIGGKTFDEAANEAWVLPGPWKYKAGWHHISDVFNDFRAYCQENDLDPDDREEFKKWARDVYDVSDHASQ